MSGAREHPVLAPGTRPAPGYRVLGHLARTGWLDLYDSWSEERACRCVVKVLRPDRRTEEKAAERLLREGRWLCEFTHPHLVRGYEVRTAPQPLVVLETLSGETLSCLLHRLRRRPAATDLALLGVQLCSAVHYLHGRGLLHLDLKPSNVVVDCGRAKVLDLSVARPPGHAPPGMGTFSYLAPEQARGGPLSAAADVWGIGVTLYEAAAGDVPFDRGETVPSGSGSDGGDGNGSHHGAGGDSGVGDGGSVRATGGGQDWYPQLETSAPPIGTRRRLPRALAEAVDGCLRQDPAARPTVPELAAALRALLPDGLSGPTARAVGTGSPGDQDRGPGRPEPGPGAVRTGSPESRA
ncbi:serine/threonine-protein kinase [Streptomyces sp. NRRL S-340]|uniref:serine/threonine-protein kinase n=1 Tax=Streptomyces sp. NRRL S-340 TaxID=1463901 RepID=UPI000D1B24BF|nr:serine/threonine-protein kinase [Streptomyces sp. NRRL S-340]